MRNREINLARGLSAVTKGDKSVEPGVELSEVELAERMDRLRTMGRTIGEDFAMGVVIGKEPGWRYKFKPINTIEVDPEDIKRKGLEYCFGIIAHEGAHRRVSRTDFIPKKIWQEAGFSFLFNAVEDPRVNNWVIGKYDGAANWMEEVYSEDLPTEDRVDATTEEKLGYIPKHIKYGLEVIRYWHSGKFSDDVPEEVREVLKTTIAYAEEAYKTLPAKDPAEEDIERKARVMYELVRAKIWPEYQKLVEQSLTDEAVRQMIKEMMEKGELDLPNEARSEKKDKQPEADESGGEGEKGEPLPLDQMPEDIRQEIEKRLRGKLEEMSPEEREAVIAEMEEKAKGVFEGLETDLVKELRGRFSDQPETTTEERERQRREEDAAEVAKKRAADLAKAKEELERRLEEQKSEYQKAYEEIKPYIDKVAEDLMNIFIAKRFPQFRARFPGQKLRLQGAMDYESRKEYRKLFEARIPSERPDYTFLLLVDLSGSMAGSKIQETFKGAVLFAEALAKVAATMGGAKVAIYGFQDELIRYKYFDDELNDQIREGMNVMQKEVSNKGQHNRANYNNDGYCVDNASAILRSEQGENKFLVVLSDGQPEGDSAHRVSRYAFLNQSEELKRVVEDISRSQDQYLLGIGLGPGTDHVAAYYPSVLPNVENIPNVNVSRLAEVLGNKLEELIK